MVHEAWPGHALQKSLARELQPASPMSQLVGNPAYSEGWARYAEALAEERRTLQQGCADPAPGVARARNGRRSRFARHALEPPTGDRLPPCRVTGRYDTGSADDYVSRTAWPSCRGS